MSPEIEEVDNRPWVAAIHNGRWVRMLATPAMIKNGIIEIYRRRDSTALERIMSKVPPKVLDPNTLSQRGLQELCRRNGFHIRSVTGQTEEEQRLENSKKKPARPLNMKRSELRKVHPISKEDFKRVYKELLRIDVQVALIVKILWVLNCKNSSSGSYITLEELLRLERTNISIEKYVEPGQEGNPIILWVGLELWRSTRNGEALTIQPIFPHLWKPLLKQVKENSIFIFSNRCGGPIHPHRVDKLLKEAGKRVGIKGLTSLALRPAFNSKQAKRYAKRHRFDGELPECFQPITQDELEALCAEFPSIRPSRGRKPSHGLLDILNALMYSLRPGCSIKKLIDPFPPPSAVESQCRRWESSGILDKVLDWLIKKRRHEFHQQIEKRKMNSTLTQKISQE